MSTELPPGFTLDKPRPAGLPAGFTLDAPPAAQEGSILDGPRAVAAELGAAAMRPIAEMVDFVVPDTYNAASRLMGSDSRMPTLRDTLEPMGIEGNFMEPGTGRDLVRGGGNALGVGAGLVPSQGRNLAKPLGAAAEFLGIGAAKAPSALTGASLSQQALDALPEVERALLSGSGDVITATKQLDPSAPPQSPVAIDYPAGKESIKQGFEDGFVAMVKESPEKAKKKMLAVLNIMEKGKQNFRYRDNNRPLKVVGDSIVSRIKVVREANRVAGKQLGQEAKNLKGQSLDYSGAVASFEDSLKELGVKFSPKDRTLSFQGSDFEGLKDPEGAIKRILGRMMSERGHDGTPNIDAYDLHRLKKFIDENVTYGSDAGGLKGTAERVLKTFRHDINETLGAAFPEYARVNKQYSETIKAIDDFQDVAGQKMDLYGPYANDAIGGLARRLLSNAASRVPLKIAVKQLDDTAKKFMSPGGKDIVPYEKISERSGVKITDMDDDVIAQISFVDQLENILGPTARTSLFGDVDKAIDRGAQVASGGIGGAVIGLAADGLKYGRRINEKNAIKSIRTLLKEQK
jgi:hypothetical protein